MLVFSAITPHPPILIPTIGKENLEQIKNTVEAMKNLEEKLIAAKPDLIIIISPHGPLAADAFTINVSSQYQSSFGDFGDFATKLNWKTDLKFIAKIKYSLATAEIPLTVIKETKLDHGVTVPLFYLTQQLPKIKIIPLGYSLLDLPTHLMLGQRLKQEIDASKLRIAVIASGDLSHCLTQDAPAGYNEQGQKFDDKLIELLNQKDLNGIINLDPTLIEQAGECGLRSVMILLGILKDLDYQPEKLSYEGPFGVGYLVVNFKV